MTEAPTDEQFEELLQPLWLAGRPSREAQNIRSKLSTDFDLPGLKQWASDFMPDYIWLLVDIAAQRGIDLGRRMPK
jgi:hypothetical protein